MQILKLSKLELRSLLKRHNKKISKDNQQLAMFAIQF
jgi:hypothetical protein